MKLILCILFVLIFKEDACAKTYYSDYSNFTDYSLDKIESSDTINVETKKIYNKYFDVAEGEYYLMGENPNNYPYINVNIYKDTLYSDWSEDYPEDKYSRIIEVKKECDDNECISYHLEYRYKDRLYYHYQKNQKKLSENSVLKGYIKDEDDYIQYYRYQIRDKLDIDDNIIITSIDSKLEQFITCTTKYEIEGTINYLKNGTYTVKVITEFIEVPIKVQVLIENNTINLYEHLLNDKTIIIDELNNKLKNNIKKINQLELDYKNILAEDNNTKEELRNIKQNYNNCKTNLLEIQKKLNDEKRESETKYQNILIENIVNKKELKSVEQKYTICENNFLGLQQTFKSKQLELENKLKLNKNQLILLENKVWLKENSIVQLKQTINNLQENLKNADLNFQIQQDSLKKLELCEKVNLDLNEKFDQNKLVNHQNTFYIFFVGTLLFFTVFAFLKIKSMKKNN